MAGPLVPPVVFGPQAGPLSTGLLDQNYNYLAFLIYDSVAQLRLTTPKTATIQPPRVYLTGNLTVGDGLGGWYWYNPADTTSADNGTTIIVASDGGRWVLTTQNTAVTSSGVRQCVLYGLTDSNGNPNFISAGAGLNFNITSVPTLVLTFANNVTDNNATLTSNFTNQGTLAANTINYLTADFVTQSLVTWSDYQVPPQYGYSFDRTLNALLNFEGANGATITTDDFGNAWTLTGATITTLQFKFGTSCLDCTGGTNKYATTSDIKMMSSGSWEENIWFRINALPASGLRGTIFNALNTTNNISAVVLNLFNNAGITKLELGLSSNGTSLDIANLVVGANTVWTLNQWNRARIVFDALAGTYRVYLSLNGVAETQDITISSFSRVCNFAGVWLGITGTIVNPFNGWLDANRLIQCATVIGIQTPSASAPSISDFPINWFDMANQQMKEVTGASAASGTNPTFTVRNRLFIGEADTGAATVSAIRHYGMNQPIIPFVELRKNLVQSGIANGAATKVTFSSAWKNFNRLYDAVNDRLTPTPGKWRINCTIEVTIAGTGSPNMTLFLYKNGSLYKSYEGKGSPATAAIKYSLSQDITIVIGDYLEIYMQTANASSTAIITASSVIPEGASVTFLTLTKI